MPKAKKKSTAVKVTKKKTVKPKKKPVTKRQAKVKTVKRTPENAVAHDAILAEGVCIECEQGFIRLVDSTGLSKVLKEVNAELKKLTDGFVAITERGTREIDGVDTCELAEKLRY